MDEYRRKAFLVGKQSSFQWRTRKLGRSYVEYLADEGGCLTQIYHVGTTKRKYGPGSIVICEYRPWPVGKDWFQSGACYWQVV